MLAMHKRYQLRFSAATRASRHYSKTEENINKAYEWVALGLAPRLSTIQYLNKNSHRSDCPRAVKCPKKLFFVVTVRYFCKLQRPSTAGAV